jgi:hypothetical protein
MKNESRGTKNLVKGFSMPKSDTKKKLVQHNIVKKLSLDLVKGDIAKASGHSLVLFARPG